ncbi:MAG: methanogenesis marker 14 protein [Candidatus Thorarchaeota archaeon]
MRYRIIHPRGISMLSVRLGSFFTVASVELGNTTTKCIVVTTNLKTAEVFEIGKEVRMTRDIRLPWDGETPFGHTITRRPLTREAVSEMVSDILTTTVKRNGMDMKTDLDFVVRSTGVTAGFAHPDEVDGMIRALADGCLNAGVPPGKMMAAMSVINLNPRLRSHSWLNKVHFDGAVASCLPPAGRQVVANEMEGELVTAGIKGAAKGTGIDFRNPVATMDFGTTLAGRITDDSYPYANTVASFVGLAGAIPDAVVRGTGFVDRNEGCTIDLTLPHKREEIEESSSWLEEASRIITVDRVPRGVERFGTVPVDMRAAEEADLTLLGVDVGCNGSRLADLGEIGLSIVQEKGPEILHSFLDHLQARIVHRLIELAESEGLVNGRTSIGLTGRAITTGMKPELISSWLERSGVLPQREQDIVVFVEDGLAFGAAVAARCMNSLGTPHEPMGGRRGDRCIMGARMAIQSGRAGEVRRNSADN